jgi:hypothetical protein
MSETFVLINGAWHGGMVGHSRGGHPMTGAAHGLPPRLKKLVYSSAFVPAEGQCLLDEVPPPYVELSNAMAGASGNNSVALPFEMFAGGVIQDATPEPRFPERLGVTAITGPGSHEACFTRPAELAASFIAA